MNQSVSIKNFKLVIEYDGTFLNGWQIQKTGRTVQGEIEAAITKMTGKQVRVAGSGRTDAGVHALGQVAAFRCETRLAPETFFSGLNSLLPDDIVVLSCEAAPLDFHPRFDAAGKTYIYRIHNRPTAIAIGRKYAWHIKKQLDIHAMTQAIGHIIGTHDFKSFENTGSPRSHTVRTVSSASVSCCGKIVAIRITANGFLRYMVRNLTGTLVDVGLSKLSPADFAYIMHLKDRSRASATAPPHGLFLHSVYYTGTQ
jgi:tRNA pseudouridine38-40 synthase